MDKKTHICDRMIQYIEHQGVTVSSWEEQAKKNGVKISVGYLRKALKDGTNIGFEILDYFLRVFPNVNERWLLQIDKFAQMEKNNTSVHNGAAVAESSWEAAAFRKVIEGDAEYVLVHKTAFENHRFTSVEQIQAQAKELADARAEIERLVKEYIQFVKDTYGLGRLPEPPKIEETKKGAAV